MYRIKEGDRVLLIDEDDTTKIVTFERTVDFVKKDLVASPLTEHNKEGIPQSDLKFQFVPGDSNYWEWGFNVRNKWDDVGTTVELFAQQVHMVPNGTSLNESTVVIAGSGKNQYTLTFDDESEAHTPISCTCMGFRFKQQCKHMDNWRDYVYGTAP